MVVRERLNALFFLYIGSFLIPEFFRHTNSVTDKIVGAIWGAGFSLPLGEPRNF